MLVEIVFNGGSGDYQLPHVFHVSDPVAGTKDTIIHGKRGSGCIAIPGGKKSNEIIVRGNLHASNYATLTDLINEMRTEITSNTATLTLKHFDGGWTNDWVYSVKRIKEITFAKSLRTSLQEYEVKFLILAF